MGCVCIIDTSVFLNLLNVPGRNESMQKVKDAYKEYVDLKATFILPMATIVETGNHIAQNGNGYTRRETAKRFCEVVKGAFSGEAPYRPSEFPDATSILKWIDEFPEYAGRNKSDSKATEGTSFGDLSIIKEYEKCVDRFPMTEVFIWSLDDDLSSRYHHEGQKGFSYTHSEKNRF